MRRIYGYVLKRALLLIPQTFILVTAVFTAVHLLPGDPVYAMLGTMARPETVAARRHQLGLDLPLHEQFIRYLVGFRDGDLGDSLRTGQPVLTDLKMRFPATAELLILGMTIAIAVGIVVGVITAWKPGGLVDRATMLYGLLSGALPEFYMGLIFIFVFYVVLSVAPHPAGRLDLTIPKPPRVTGMYLVDSALAGQGETFRNAAYHLMLPVFTLFLWQTGAIMKMTRSTMLQIMDGDFIQYARVVGLKPGIIRRYALRNALAPVVALTIIIFGILLGSTVLIETVFSWGGLGQYSVQSVVYADYEAILGFLLVASVFSLLLYIILDIMHVIIDPRLEL
jgi:ABC-type dipeptide/oligopeptide/nickel transport system permease component